DDQRVDDFELVEGLAQRLGLRITDRRLVEDDDAPVLGLGGERVLEGERAHLLRESVFVAARPRAEGAAAAAEQIGALRTVPGAAGTFLAVDFLAGAVDLGAVLDRMSAGSPLGELPDDAALNDVG